MTVLIKYELNPLNGGYPAEHVVLLRSVTHRPAAQSKLDGVQIGDGTPHLSDQTLVGDIEAAQVQDVVDCLHLFHLHDPRVG